MVSCSTVFALASLDQPSSSRFRFACRALRGARASWPAARTIHSVHMLEWRVKNAEMNVARLDFKGHRLLTRTRGMCIPSAHMHFPLIAHSHVLRVPCLPTVDSIPQESVARGCSPSSSALRASRPFDTSLPCSSAIDVFQLPKGRENAARTRPPCARPRQLAAAGRWQRTTLHMCGVWQGVRTATGPGSRFSRSWGRRRGRRPVHCGLQG